MRAGVSILQFFSKLSQGTAQMTTSRQALRLGKYLSISRLLGFYYAHIGSYLGQLHYSHVTRASRTGCLSLHATHGPAASSRAAPPSTRIESMGWPLS